MNILSPKIILFFLVLLIALLLWSYYKQNEPEKFVSITPSVIPHSTTDPIAKEGQKVEYTSYADIYYDHDGSRIAAYVPKFGKVSQSIENLIHFEVPKTFTKKVEQNVIILQSPDYNVKNLTDVTGININIKVHQSSNPLEFIKRLPEMDQSYYAFDKQETTVAGLNAIKFYSGYEAFIRSYIIAQGDKLWIISIHTAGKEADLKLNGTIEGFIQSMSFNTTD